MEQCYNRVVLCGRAATAPVLSHINHGIAFCRFILSVPRLSGQSDDIPVLLPQHMAATIEAGSIYTVCGELRSFNNRSGVGARLVIDLLARSVTPGGEFPFNRIRLSGVLCKLPSLRRTPLGREICDLTLAVNRRCGRSDYLPCIAWGAVAESAALLSIGDRFTFEGRVQSRTYRKNLGATVEERVAYEVSVMRPASVAEWTLDESPLPPYNVVSYR